MPLDRPSLSTIYGRLKADTEGLLQTTNWSSRPLVLIILAVCAGAFYSLYGFILQMARQLFFTTAEPEYLNRFKRLYGLPDRTGSRAEGTLLFTGADSTVIPEGTEVTAVGGELFLTVAEATIASGVAEVDITANEVGVDYNLTVTEMTLVTAIPGVDDTASVLVLPAGGVDPETRAELVYRLLRRTQNPPASGNEGDYERWALTVDGVGRVWIRGGDAWAGAGTVGVILATSALQAVPTAVRTDVADYIASVKPVGAGFVSVVDPIIKNVTLNVAIIPNTSDLRDAITAALNDAFLLSSNPGESLKISTVRKAISNTSVDDYNITAMAIDGVPQTIGDLPAIGIELLRFQSATYSLLS